MYHNLNQLQWQLERDKFYGHVSKTCLVVLRTQFMEFFYSKEVNASDFLNKCWQKRFSDSAKWEPEAYRCLLLRYLEELDKFIDEKALKYRELQIKESEVQAIKEIKNQLKEKEIQQQESLVIEGTTLEACLVNECLELNDNTGVTEGSGTESENSSSETPFSSSGNENRSSDYESNSLGNDADAKMMLVDTTASAIKTDDIRTSYDSDTVSEVHPNMFENVFAHGIQNYEQPTSSPNTYVVNENNSDITYDIPNMDLDRGKEEHDDVNYEHKHAFFASLINNLKCDVEKCNKVNSEAQQVNALLTNELERYKEKEKHFAKDMTIDSEYCKKIKLLNDEISNLKSQACEKDKTFTKENKKYDEYVKPLLKGI
ncbi:hypothetical protein Tco_0364441 [Tanacetum coccineum]